LCRLPSAPTVATNGETGDGLQAMTGPPWDVITRSDLAVCEKLKSTRQMAPQASSNHRYTPEI